MPHLPPPNDPSSRHSFAGHSSTVDNLQRPGLLSRNSSYLTPIQEQRILSWRTHTSPLSSGSSSSSKPAKSQSAPPSIATSRKAGSPAHSPCPVCAAQTQSICSCSSNAKRSQGRRRSYYSSKKKGQGMSSGMTSLTPVTSVTSQASRHVQYAVDPGASFQEQGNAGRPPPIKVDKKGLPTAEQVAAYRSGTAPLHQYGPVPLSPLPEPVQAAPKEPELPRIAGARDPVTQN